MKTKAFVALLAALVLLSSCGKNFRGINFNFSDRKKLEVRNFDYTYLSAKAKFSFKDEKSDVNAKANFRFRKDSIIWFSFASGVGIEGARGIVTPDTVVIIDRVNKQYMAYDFAAFSDRFGYPVDFQMVQNMILGNLILARSEADEVIEKDDLFHLLQQGGKVKVDNSINRTTFKIEDVLVSEMNSNNELNIHYDRFGLVGEFAFPYLTHVDLNYQDPQGNSRQSMVEIDYNKVEQEDSQLRFPFKIPSKYQLITDR